MSTPRPENPVGLAESRQEPASDSESRVWQAAVSLFARKGYAATGIRDIAKAAGITSATLYHYTSSKQDLLVRIMVHGQWLLTSTARDALTHVNTPEHRLGALVGNLVTAHATNPLSTSVIDNEIRAFTPVSTERATVIELRDEYEGLWRQTIDSGVAQGVFHTSDSHLTRLGLLTMCSGMSRWYRPDGRDDLYRLCEHFVDIALGAVHARRDGQWLRGAQLMPLPLPTGIHLPWEPEPYA